MKHPLTPIALAALLASAPALAQQQPPSGAAAEKLAPVLVSAPAEAPDTSSTLGAAALDAATLGQRRVWGSDTAALLHDVPGMSSQGAGGVSSLPVLRGLADERLRIQVDGMDLMPACPNHMNPVLSYIAPPQVGQVRVFAGVTPVSVGGDNIGGTVQVQSVAPEFAQPGAGLLLKGEAGVFYRSNGKARGADVAASVATEKISLRYSGSTARSGNYLAGGNFKPEFNEQQRRTDKGHVVPDDEVGSSEFESRNQRLGLALRHNAHLLQLDADWQNAPYEGFPNQRMDMTSNKSWHYNLRYSGQFEWGALRTQLWQQTTEHKMDMGPDRHFYGTGMPMDTWVRTRGASVQGDVLLSARDTLRLGAEHLRYTLYDWWPPVDTGSMGPNDFWNLNFGRRHKSDVFAEWEAQWSPRWTTLLGARYSQVMNDAADIQGYNREPTYALDADAFNAQPRQRTDRNWDATAQARFTPSAAQTYELGLARKSRSPSLYQLYPWSTNTMAIGMNNFAGDGNGYVGNLLLKPEVAYTASLTGDWHEAQDNPRWGLKATGYVTQVKDYIDADRCPMSLCNYPEQASGTDYVMLRYANHDARLLGLEVSGHAQINDSERWGQSTLRGSLGYVRGTNRDTKDGLFSVMPLNAKLALEHKLGRWSGALEWEGVAAKTRLSAVRNELRTPGYGLLNLRLSYTTKHLRVDAGVDNVFNRLYAPPLGGAYVGQGRSMMLGTVPWGTAVPGKGRSFNVALRLMY